LTVYITEKRANCHLPSFQNRMLVYNFIFLTHLWVLSVLAWILNDSCRENIIYTDHRLKCCSWHGSEISLHPFQTAAMSQIP